MHFIIRGIAVIASLPVLLSACISVEPAAYREIRLPPSSQPSPAERPVYVRLLANGEIYVLDIQSSAETLIDDTTAAARSTDPHGNPHDKRIYIRLERGVPYATFVAISDRLLADGFYSVALVTDDDL